MASQWCGLSCLRARTLTPWHACLPATGRQGELHVHFVHGALGSWYLALPIATEFNAFADPTNYSINRYAKPAPAECLLGQGDGKGTKWSVCELKDYWTRTEVDQVHSPPPIDFSLSLLARVPHYYSDW